MGRHWFRSHRCHSRYCFVLLSFLLIGICQGSKRALAVESVTTLGQVLERVSRTAAAEVAAATTELASAELDQARSKSLPVLTVDAQDNLTGDPNSYEPEYTLRIEQMVFDWGRQNKNVEARRATLQASQNGEKEVVLDAKLQAAEAFHGISVVNRKREANKKNRRSLEDLRSMMERRVANRVSPNIDLHEVESRIHLLDIADRQLEAEKRALQLVVIRLAGVNVVDPDLVECLQDAPLDEESLIEKALAVSPTLQRLRHQAERSDYDGKAVDADRFPSVVAGYRADSDLDGDEFDQRAYVALRYEFQAGGQLNARRAAEHARLIEQRALFRTEAETITQTIGAWVSTYETSVSLADVYRQLSVAKAAQRESHLRRFLVGRSSWRDVLGAQQEMAESMTGLIDAEGSACLSSSALSLLTGGVGGVQ